MRSASLSVVVVVVAALLLVSVRATEARADVAPGQPVCSEPSGQECIVGTLGREEVDDCTMKEVKRVGLRFHCGMSSNDRLSTWWCRPRRLPAAPSAPPENATEAQQDAYFAKLEKHTQLRWAAFGNLDRELSFGSYSDRYFAEQRSTLGLKHHIQQVDPMRFDCFALASKFRRCEMNIERCTPYWEKFKELSGGEEYGAAGPSLGGNEIEIARAAMAAIDPKVRIDDAGPTDASSDAEVASPPSPPQPPPKKSCSCEAMGSSHNTNGFYAALLFALFFIVSRRATRA